MLKICSDSICRPLNIIFKVCLSTGKFPLEKKNVSIVPIHKKVEKPTVINYSSVSLYQFVVKYFSDCFIMKS